MFIWASGYRVRNALTIRRRVWGIRSWADTTDTSCVTSAFNAPDRRESRASTWLIAISATTAPAEVSSRGRLTRFLDLENVDGVKWSTHDQSHFMTISRLFADKFSFIDNQATNHLSLSMKLGFAGFINSDGLVAPRLVLHLWDLWKQNRREEYDDLLLRFYVDPSLGLAQPEDITWTSMGEGPHVRIGMEGLGMHMGPAFPAQMPLSDDSIRRRTESFAKDGIMDWADWSDELWEKAKSGKSAAAALAGDGD